MAIIADFSAVPVKGPLSTAFQFTDLSQGSPTSWMWEFGDGFTSTEQHPVHTYTVAGIYTVKLVAFIITGTSFPWLDPQSAVKREGTGSTNVLAYSAFVASGFVNDPGGEFADIVYLLDRVSASVYNYLARKITFNPNLLSHAGRVIMLYIQYETVPDVPSYGVLAPFGGALRVPPDETEIFVSDLSSFGGSAPVLEFSDLSNYSILPDVGAGSSSGWAEQALFLKSHSVSDSDTLIKSAYITAGVDWCGKGWMMISKTVIQISPGVNELIVETEKPAHLWAGYMIEEPSKDRVWTTKYGMPHRCQPIFDIGLDGQEEQQESGDTLIHTFDMSGMSLLDRLFLILSGEQCGKISNSRSPIFEVDNS